MDHPKIVFKVDPMQILLPHLHPRKFNTLNLVIKCIYPSKRTLNQKGRIDQEKAEVEDQMVLLEGLVTTPKRVLLNCLQGKII